MIVFEREERNGKEMCVLANISASHIWIAISNEIFPSFDVILADTLVSRYMWGVVRTHSALQYNFDVCLDADDDDGDGIQLLSIHSWITYWCVYQIMHWLLFATIEWHTTHRWYDTSARIDEMSKHIIRHKYDKYCNIGAIYLHFFCVWLSFHIINYLPFYSYFSYIYLFFESIFGFSLYFSITQCQTYFTIVIVIEIHKKQHKFCLYFTSYSLSPLFCLIVSLRVINV